MNRPTLTLSSGTEESLHFLSTFGLSCPRPENHPGVLTPVRVHGLERKYKAPTMWQQPSIYLLRMFYVPQSICIRSAGLSIKTSQDFIRSSQQCSVNRPVSAACDPENNEVSDAIISKHGFKRVANDILVTTCRNAQLRPYDPR